jgi:hypothetical protein
MTIHAFKDYHFLELRDDNGDIIRYTAKEVFDHLLDQYIQPEDVTDQITGLHKILEQPYNPNEEPQVKYKLVQDARNTLESLKGGSRWLYANISNYITGTDRHSVCGRTIFPLDASLQKGVSSEVQSSCSNISTVSSTNNY